jgi:MFS family permease
MLPLVSEDLGSRQESIGAIFMAATIIVPQLIVAVAGPWVGHYAEQWCRKPILLIGFGLEPIRSALLGISQSPFFIMEAQT